MSWFYHNRVWMWLYFGITAVLNLLPWPTSIGLVFTCLNFVGIAGAIIVSVEQIKHKRATCLKCMSQVPTNAAWLAQEKVERLRFYHWVMNWITLPKMAVTGLAYIGIVLIANRTEGDFIQWVMIIPVIVFWSFIVYNVVCEYTHERLRSFCPYCKDEGDGGWFLVIDVPDPSGSKMA